jgi:hypothetical protein
MGGDQSLNNNEKSKTELKEKKNFPKWHFVHRKFDMDLPIVPRKYILSFE